MLAAAAARRAVVVVATALALFVLAPPAAAKGRGKRENPRAEVTKEGRIRVVRSIDGGYPQLTDERGKHFLLIGAWRAELRRLSGHVVRIWGTPAKKRLMFPTIKVRRYKITNSGGGRKPVVGRLRVVAKKKLRLAHANGTYRVQAKRPLARRMRKRDGCRVWVVGDLSGNTLRAFKFGWLSCKRGRPIKAPKTRSRASLHDDHRS